MPSWWNINALSLSKSSCMGSFANNRLDELTARGESPAAFGRRCIPPPPQRGCRVGDPGVELRCSSLKYSRYSHSSRLAQAGRVIVARALGATPDSHHGLQPCWRPQMLTDSYIFGGGRGTASPWDFRADPELRHCARARAIGTARLARAAKWATKSRQEGPMSDD